MAGTKKDGPGANTADAGKQQGQQGKSQQGQGQGQTHAQDRGLTSQIGPVAIDWPRSIGYFGGIGLAVAAGVIEPPVGLFLAAIPLFKMLNRPKNPLPVRLVAQVLDGAAKPVGGDADATIQLNTPDTPAPIGPRVGSQRGAAQEPSPA